MSQTPLPELPSINIQRLASELKSRRGKRGLRSVAEEITAKYGKVSASTLSRIEQDGVPDLATYLRVCNWLGMSADELTQNKKVSRLVESADCDDTPQLIEAHFRAEKVLPAETIEALSKMIRQAYKWAENSAPDSAEK